MTSPARPRFCLVDAHGYLHRAYHALSRMGRPLTNSRGEPTGALFGFAKMLIKVLRENRPDRVAVCFDAPGPTFRHRAYAEYKAHRKEIEPDLKFQLPLAQDLVRAWGLPTVVKPGYEADDLIATLAARGVRDGFDVLIVTGDKDALQLVDDRVSVLNEAKNIVYTPAEVEKKYGLRPDQLVDYFALTGDASDNVPGVPGVGDKTATKLLQEFASLDAMLRHPDRLPEKIRHKLLDHRNDADLSRRLVVLDRDAPIDEKPADCRPPEAPQPALMEFLRRYEFNSLLSELGGEGRPAAASRSRAGAAAPAVPGTTRPARPAAPPVERRVRTVLAPGDLKDLAADLAGADHLAVDVETTGLDPFACALVGIALATRPGEAWYVPVGHRGLGEPPSWPLEKIRPVLGPPLSDPKLPKVGQNLKFDGHVLERHGLPLVGVSFDTLVASYCLNPSRPNHGLKTLALDLLGESMTPIENLIGSGAKALTMDQVPVERAALYAGADAEVTLRLKALMEKDLRDHRMDRLFYDVEMPLVGILSDMETAGLGLNVPYLQKLSREFGESLAGLEKEIHGLAGETFNVNSPKQLAVVLFEKLKLPVLRKTKTGYSTDEEVLQTLSDRHPLPARVVAYRELAKLKSTYVDGLLELVDPQTHRVHTRLNQAVAATGRLSSSDPNLQNIPIRTDAGRKIRRAFVPSEGNVFLSADYSQIDLRVLAHMSGDPALVRAFRRGEDVHAATARDIFDLGPDAPVTDDQRRVAKSVNFGIVYGQTPFGLSQQLKIPLPQAQEYIRRYLEKYAGVQAWVEATLERARRDGYVTTLLHRRRYLPEINASNGNVRAFAERTAMNTPIQGTSADIIKVAMREVTAWMAKHGGRARLLLQVHDDLLFDVPRGELAALAPAVRRLMESAVPLDVPVVVDLKTGPNWADMKKGEPAA